MLSRTSGTILSPSQLFAEAVIDLFPDITYLVGTGGLGLASLPTEYM